MTLSVLISGLPQNLTRNELGLLLIRVFFEKDGSGKTAGV